MSDLLQVSLGCVPTMDPGTSPRPSVLSYMVYMLRSPSHAPPFIVTPHHIFAKSATCTFANSCAMCSARYASRELDDRPVISLGDGGEKRRHLLRGDPFVGCMEAKRILRKD
mmetsp:Transcript_33725/g.67196  ORF Transcript_33725/g.67196 Transcript_33725/m.67196 type:complete len:112 (-) Transcript_33725:829-1164(-)